MATKKIDLKTFLMKIVNIFPKDMYLVHNWCAIAGTESDDENRGLYICILNSDVRELLNKSFPNNPVIYIKSVRDAKADVTKIDEVLDEKIIKNIENTVDSFMKSFNNYDTWETFNFTETEINDLFEERKSLMLFENDENRSPLIISKSVFPLITGKNINDVKFVYDIYGDGKDLNQIIMSYDYDLFQLIMRYIFLKI